MDKEKYSRAVYIDILRIIACLFVIFNHTNERGFYRYVYSDELGLFNWMRNLFFSIICKSAVPIFFMISGSMLLRKEESIKRTLMRIPKILIDLLLFSFAYLGTDAILAGNEFTLKDTLQTILQSSYWHLWYLYAYIAFIFTLPFFRKFVKSLDEKTSLYMFMLTAVFMCIVPLLEHFFHISINMNLKQNWITINVFIYPVIGYVLDNKINVLKMKKISLIWIWVINFLCFIVSEICEYQYLIKESGDIYNEMFLSSFCIINASSIFITVKYLFEKKKINLVVYKLITEAGKCAFGIYLLHIWVLWKIPVFYNCWIKVEQVGYAGVLVSCIVVFIITGAMTYILRKIPIVRRLF